MLESINWLSLVLAFTFLVYAHRSYKRLRYVQVMFYGHPDGGRALFFEAVLFSSIAAALFMGYSFITSLQGVL